MLFALRAGLLAGLIALTALASLSLLSALTTDRGLRDLEVERLRYLVSSLRATVEANLTLGLPIEDLPALQSLLERDLGTEPGVRAIEIIGPTGRTLYSTERGAIGAGLPEVWQEAIADSRNDIWLADDRGEVVIGEIIRNDFELPTGHVVLIVAGSQIDPPLSFTLQLAGVGWKAVLISGGLMTFLVFLLVQLRLRQVGRVTAVWTKPWSDAMTQEADDRTVRPLMRLASLRARRRGEQATQEFERARQALTELDDAD
ncbi:MAG: hypothetical protein AAFY02_13020 [Pseudomonadota bacterium]